MTTYEEALKKCKDRMPQPLNDWIKALNLEEEFAYILYTATTWTKHCAFDTTTDSNRAIATLDLALWLFFLDDYEHASYDLFFDRCGLILDRKPDPEPNTKILLALRDVIDRVTAMDKPMDRFIEDRHRLIQCYRTRNAVRKGRPISFDEYFAIRLTTVYVDHWIGIWEILDNFYLTQEERDHPDIQELVLHLKTWHILENEIESLDRDERDGTPNLVKIAMTETKRSKAVCVKELRATRDEAALKFAQISDRFSSEEHEKHMCKYVDFLRISMWGGTGNYEDNQGRYHHSVQS